MPRDESALIIMNHRCRLDWMFYFMVLLRTGRLDHEKIILRDDLKLVPGPGNVQDLRPLSKFSYCISLHVICSLLHTF